MSETLDTNAKALKLNIDHSAYGAFAEIGGGREASRWFFRVGGAAGTVARTLSAYDMAVSDATYGSGERYVSRERLCSMLAHEFNTVVKLLTPSRGDKTAFFAFADTVATRSFKGGNECHGWIGIRFQHEPGAAPSDILLHTALQDPTAQLQQRTLGTLGVNLIFAAYYLRGSFADMLKSLLDGLSLENVEIDLVDCSGPAFANPPEQRAVAIEMLTQGLTRAVVFDEQHRMEQPSTVFRKRALLIHRCSMKRDNTELDQMLHGAVSMLQAEGNTGELKPLCLLELSMPNDAADNDTPSGDRRAIIDRAFRPGHAAMLTSLPETFRVSTFVRRYSADPIRFVLGLDSVITILRDSFYAGRLEGGLLEGLGRVLSPNTKLYIFPMPAAILRERLKPHNIEPGFWSAPDNPVLTADDITLARPAGHLLDFLKSAGWVKSAATLPTERPR